MLLDRTPWAQKMGLSDQEYNGLIKYLVFFMFETMYSCIVMNISRKEDLALVPHPCISASQQKHSVLHVKPVCTS